jgi:putative ABC transport system ATP-binding protein
MAVVRVKDLVKEYDLGQTKVKALQGVSFSLEHGEFVAVAGPSGSGKSTLLNMLGCLDYPTAGEVWIDQTMANNLKEKQLDRLRLYTLGFIFQSFNLIPVLNVYENVELPLLIRKDITAAEKKARVKYFVDEVGLTGQRKQRPAELSGGQRQRVATARALVTKPEIVLADEPTANLDSKTGIEIIELMHEINKREQTTFIFSTHDPKIIERADRILYLEDGKLTEEKRS